MTVFQCLRYEALPGIMVLGGVLIDTKRYYDPMKPNSTPTGRRVYNDFVLFEKADYVLSGIQWRTWKALQNVFE